MPAVTDSDLSKPVTAFMQPVQTTVRADHTVAQALAELRSRTIDAKAVYLYVVDAANRLVGVISTRAVLLAGPDDRIERLMQRHVVAVPATANLELAMELFAMHRLLALPVVHDDGRLLGQVDVQIYTDEVFDLADARRAADVFQLIGLGVQQLREGSSVRAFRARLPWLTCNLLGGIACALIAAVFDEVLAAVLVLAMFTPLVLTLSESISVQALTMSLQQLHGQAVDWRSVRRRLTREWRTALLLGATLGLIVAVVSLAWGPQRATPIVVGLSVLVAMLVAATLGTLVPVLLHAARLDPRLAAGPVVLTLTDMATMAVYLGLATWTLL